MGFLRSLTAAGGVVGTHLAFSIAYLFPELARAGLKGTVITAEIIEKMARYTAEKANSAESAVNLLMSAMERKEESICNKINAWAERGHLPSDQEVSDLVEELLKLNKGQAI